MKQDATHQRPRKALIVAVTFATITLSPIFLLTAIRPNFAFEKRTLSKPIVLKSGTAVEYGWLRGSQEMFGDGKDRSSFEVTGLCYIGYRSNGKVVYHWYPHIVTRVEYKFDVGKGKMQVTNFQLGVR